jgi:uncharacterized membrane protein
VIDLNDLLALTMLALLWLAISLALRRSLHGPDSRRPVASSMVRLRRTDLRNHAVHAWPDR